MNRERRAELDVWALIPARSLVTGKSRLAPILDGAARHYLNASLLQHTVATAKAAFDASRVLVVSGCDEVRQAALQLGVETFRDHQQHGLNSALKQAAAEASRRGADGVLVLPCDLPLVSASDLNLLLGAARRDGQMVISPDRTNSGTNALLLSPVGAVDYSFGVGSFRRFLKQAHERHLPYRVVRSQGLSLDLDVPEDLSYWAELTRSSGASRYEFSSDVLKALRAVHVGI
ncbi:2-phospho-L-lactate guanylyltransferase [compost metagenome]